MVEAGPGLGDGGGVGQHADGPLHLGQVPARHHGRRLVVDAHLESGGAPVHELDGALGLDGGDGGVHVLGHDVSAVEHAAGHVLPVPRVALHHLVGRLEAGVGDLSDAKLLMVCFLGGDDGRVGDEGEVDSRIGDEVGLELRQVDVQGSVESQRGRDGGDDLSDQAVQVGVGGALDVEVPPADVVDGLVVHHEGAVRVLQRGVRGQDGVVRLHHGAGDLGRWVDGELQLGLLAVVDGEALHQEGREPGPGAAAEGVEDEEALQARALVGQLADSVQDQVDDLLPDCVVSPRVVVRRVLLAGDQLLRVEQLSVGPGPHLVHDGGLQVHEDSAGHVLAGAGLGEEGVEGVVPSSDGLVRGHLSVRLDAVLQAVQLPAGVPDLDSGLADVDTDTFAHCVSERVELKEAKMNECALPCYI